MRLWWYHSGNIKVNASIENLKRSSDPPTTFRHIVIFLHIHDRSINARMENIHLGKRFWLKNGPQATNTGLGLWTATPTPSPSPQEFEDGSID